MIIKKVCYPYFSPCIIPNKMIKYPCSEGFKLLKFAAFQKTVRGMISLKSYAYKLARADLYQTANQKFR